MNAFMPQEFNVSLDTRIPLEAVVLQRLQRLPQGRRPEWLRQLLLAGFRSECQTLKAGAPVRSFGLTLNAPQRPRDSTTEEQWARAHAVPATPCLTQCETQPLRTRNSPAKPFSHLKQVIGEPSTTATTRDDPDGTNRRQLCGQ